MNMTKIVSILAVSGIMAVAASCSTDRAGSPAAAPAGKLVAEQLTITKPWHPSVQYLLFLPEGYGQNPGQRWPMILFLHGSGERGNEIWMVPTNGPTSYIADHPDFPFILVCPQCPSNEVWSPDVLLSLLDDVTHGYAVDTNRIYLTGLSMGGYATWDLGLAYPEKFAAIAPVSGGGELISLILTTGEKEKALKTLGVWAFHGGKDPVVPLEDEERLVNWLKRIGVEDVKQTVYKNTLHDAWVQAYANPELYRWFLQHERH